jgi:ABC-type polysaccharide/polyol phosphate export permease
MAATIALRQQLQLARHFIARDLRNRYLGSISGALWALLQPLLLLAIYAVVFVEILKVRLPDSVGTGFVPYLATGLWPWIAFAEAVGRGTNAIPEHAALLSKVPLPRSMLVLAPVAGSFLIHGFGFAAVLLVLALAGSGVQLAGLPWALLAYLGLFAFALGLTWLTAALQVFVRDLAPIVAQLLTLWFFLTPVFFAREMIPARLAGLLAANPLAAFLEAFRAALLGAGVSGTTLLLLPLFTAIALAAGWFVFGRLSRHFEDFL